MTTEGGGTHAGNGAISRGVLTIRTIRWETVTRGGGCDKAHAFALDRATDYQVYLNLSSF